MENVLRAFRAAFEVHRYLHGNSAIGNSIASYLYEDLGELGRSPKLVQRANTGDAVVNTFNRVTGRVGRRGDGTFGVLSPSARASLEQTYATRRGPVANVEVGAEVKIIATKMTAQIDRVMTDLRNQAATFRHETSRAITVAIVGVKFADAYTGYEGKRQHIARSAPGREAPEMVRRLNQVVRSEFDELLILRFKATNRPPFAFSWVSEDEVRLEYGSALIRISDAYEQRF